MKELNLEELKRIQLDILSAVHEFCESKDIKYSISSGTLLGAKRHGGYIPWDDDIDIYLLRKDYKKLIQVFPEIYNNHYKLVSLERNAEWDRPYAKVYDTDTLLIEENSSKNHIGVNIDIFPIDNTPDLIKDWKKFNIKRRFLLDLHTIKSLKITKRRKWLKNITVALLKFPLLLLSSRKIALEIDYFAQKYNDKDYLNVYENATGKHSIKPFPKNLFADLIKIPFEDRFFYAFKESEIYLNHTYGDWERLPAKEKRITHHSFKAYILNYKF